MRTRRVDLEPIGSPAGSPIGPPIGLAVDEDGDGDRPLLLVHGFTGAKENLTPTLTLLAARGWHAVAPDLRGHGSSDAPAGEDGYDFAVMAADLVALVDALGWDRFVLVGHSLGGALAQFVALAVPHRLEALVLVSTFHGPVTAVEPELVGLGMAVVRQAGMPGLANALAAQRAANPRLLATFDQLERANPGQAAQGEKQLLACSPDMWLALAPLFHSQPDRLDRLAELDVPTLVVVGEDDRIMIDDCRRLAATIPRAQLVVIPGAWHSPHLETPEPWTAALTAFLDSLPAGAGAVRPPPGG